MTAFNAVEVGRAPEYLLDVTNPQLNPKDLAPYFRGYKQMIALRKSFNTWVSSYHYERIVKGWGRQQSILLEMTGISASGKDALRELVEDVLPVHKIVTATSRAPKEGEVHGQHYYFYNSREQFQEEIERGNFLEWTPQGDRLYGLPKVSMRDALQRTQPIKCTHVEMSAWPTVNRYIYHLPPERRPFIVKVFIMPDMPWKEYAYGWLPARRSDDVAARRRRAAWELSEAAKADFILVNPIREQPVAMESCALALIKQLEHLLHWKLLEDIDQSRKKHTPTHQWGEKVDLHQVSQGIPNDQMANYHLYQLMRAEARNREQI